MSADSGVEACDRTPGIGTTIGTAGGRIPLAERKWSVMANEYDKTRIPGLSHSFKRLIERLPEEDPNASRKELKRRIRNMIGLPQEQDDPFGDELETFYLGGRRTRRQP